MLIQSFMDSLMLHWSIHLWIHSFMDLSMVHLFISSLLRGIYQFSRYSSIQHPSIKFFFSLHPAETPKGAPSQMAYRHHFGPHWRRLRLGPAAPTGRRERKPRGPRGPRGAALRSGGAGAAAQLQTDGGLGEENENWWDAGHGETSRCWPFFDVVST